MKAQLHDKSARPKKRSKSLSDIETLLDSKIEPFQRVRQQLSEILYKIKKGDIEYVKRLAVRGFNLSAKDYDGRTPLHIAAAEGQEEIANFLLDDCNVDPNPLDRWSFTPLDEANRFDHVEIVSKLSTYGTTTVIPARNSKDNFGTDECDGRASQKQSQANDEETTLRLLYRVKEGNLEAVKRFAQQGVNMCVSDYDDRTALHIAAAEGHEGIVRFLVEHCDVDINLKDRWGHISIEEARRFGHSEIITILERYSTNLQVENNTDAQELQHCCERDLTDIGSDIGLDPTTIEQYRHALENGIETSNALRVSIIGPPNVGKTSLARNIQEHTLEGLESTDGIELYKVEFSEDLNITKNRVATTEVSERVFNASRQQNTLSDEDIGSECSVTLSDVDYTGEADLLDAPLFDNSTDEDLDGNDAENNTAAAKPDFEIKQCSYCFDPHSLQESGPFRKKTHSESSLSSMFNFQEAVRTADRHRTTIPVNIWDFGGQCEYYFIHQLFHSQRAVYIFVFDLTKRLTDLIQDENSDEQNTVFRPRDVKTFCKFWINSLHDFTGSIKEYPKVVLVGTHKDKLEGSDKDKDDYTEQYFEEIRQLFDGEDAQCHIDSEDFVINNTNPDRQEILRLKQRIQIIGKQYKPIKMPVKWVPLEIALRNGSQKFVTLDEVLDIDKESEVPVNNKEEIKAFLKIHHTLGNLIYFDAEGLSNVVILDLQWIIDAFIRIVTAERRCRKFPKLRPALEQLRKEAVLQNCLIDSVWNEDKQTYLDNKEMLLGCLNKLHILVKDTRRGSHSCDICDKEDSFIVPSLLQHGGRSLETVNTVLRTGVKTVTLAYMFHGNVISPTIFCRMMAALLSEWPVFDYRGQRLMYADIGMFKLFHDHVGVVELVDTNIEITVMNMSTSNIYKTEQAIKFKTQVESMIEQDISVPNSYTLAEKCNRGSHYVYINDLRKSRTIRCQYSEEIYSHDIELVLKQWYRQNPEVVTPEDTINLAKVIGKEWGLLALGLRIPETIITEIKQDSDTVKERICKTLKRWRAREQESATWENLFKAMRECGEVDMELVQRCYNGVSY